MDLMTEAVHTGWLGKDEVVARLHCFQAEYCNDAELPGLRAVCRTMAWALLKRMGPEAGAGADCLPAIPHKEHSMTCLSVG